VLGKFSPDQLALVGPSLDEAAQAAEAWAARGLEDAMNRFNTRVARGAAIDSTNKETT
jgi:peptidyl-tRNA hydrolase